MIALTAYHSPSYAVSMDFSSPADSLDNLLDQRLQGAWRMVIESVDPFENPTGSQIKLFSDGYFMLAVFDSHKQEYYASAGGTYAIRNGVYSEYVIFHSIDPDLVGKTFSFNLSISQDNFRQQGYVEFQDIRMNLDEEYVRLDFGEETPLAGVWRLESPGNPSTTVLRLLTGSHFQEVEYENRSRNILSSMGGKYSLRDNQWKATLHYNKNNSQAVYKDLTYDSTQQSNIWELSYSSSEGIKRELWRRLD